jgi:hypothetical protein
MKIIGIEGMAWRDLDRELQQGAKFVYFDYCISVIFVTFKRSSNIYLLRQNEPAILKGLPYTLLSVFLGWWGIPWGIIRTIQVLNTNLNGGNDVTKKVVAALRSSQQ